MGHFSTFSCSLASAWARSRACGGMNSISASEPPRAVAFEDRRALPAVWALPPERTKMDGGTWYRSPGRRQISSPRFPGWGRVRVQLRDVARSGGSRRPKAPGCAIRRHRVADPLILRRTVGDRARAARNAAAHCEWNPRACAARHHAPSLQSIFLPEGDIARRSNVGGFCSQGGGGEVVTAIGVASLYR